MRSIRRHSLKIVLLVPVIALAGCAGTVIDSRKAEDAIADNVESATGVTVTSVTCPDDVDVEAGKSFECEVATANGSGAVAELEILNEDADVRVVRLRKQ
ncbi:MAG: DUF4333 domain-containing protein [Acidobacteriota bacterium]